MNERQRQDQIRRASQKSAHRTSDGRRRRERERLSLLLLITCVLLILNLLFSIFLQIQIMNVRKTVNQAIQNLGDSQISAGSRQNQQVSSGTVNNSYDTVNPNGNSGSSAGGKDNQKENNQGGQDSDTEDPSDSENEIDYVELCGLSEVDRPVKRSTREVLTRLSELAQDSTVIKNIYDNASAYPDKMLEALANNPEMADFVAGYLDIEEVSAGDKKAGGGITRKEKEQEYPLFLQWDPRWGYEKYGDYSNVGLAGCGPTCLSMVMYYLLENEELTPDKIAKYSADNGYYIWGTGTAWALLEDYPAMYGVNVRQPGISEEAMKAALDQGRFIICSMGPGDFTTAGHFIVIYGYDQNGFKVNDSNCVARSRKQWTFEELGWQIKQVWTYGLGGSGDAGVPDYYIDNRNSGTDGTGDSHSGSEGGSGGDDREDDDEESQRDHEYDEEQGNQGDNAPTRPDEGYGHVSGGNSADG